MGKESMTMHYQREKSNVQLTYSSDNPLFHRKFVKRTYQKKYEKELFIFIYSLFLQEQGRNLHPSQVSCHIVPKIPIKKELVSITAPSGKVENWASQVLKRATRSEENFWLLLQCQGQVKLMHICLQTTLQSCNSNRNEVYVSV